MTYSIELREVSKTYQLDSIDGETLTKDAVKSVSLSISPGERVGIIGPNGAGKSTLLQMISGISDPSSGMITVQGRVTCVMTLGVALRELATGRENIYLDGEALGFTRSHVEEYLDEVIEFSELGDFIDRPVRTYSTGMKSRLAFSMLIAAEPEILLIDEALSAGDVFFAKKASAKMASLTAAGKIVIVVSHGMSSITQMCERCIWMADGTVVMDGDSQSVTEAYLENCREADARKWETDHSGINGRWSESVDWGISLGNYFQAGSVASRNSLGSGLDTEIAVFISKPPHQNTTLSLRIEKIDGLCIESRTLGVLPDGSLENARASIEFNPLLLASGKYLVEFSLVDGETGKARVNSIFEVQAPPHPGGEPLLILPALVSIESRPVTA